MKAKLLILSALTAGMFMFSCSKTQDSSVQPTVQLSASTSQAIEKVSNTIIENVDYDFQYALARLSTNDWANPTTVQKMGTESTTSYWSSHTLDTGGESFFTSNNTAVNNVKNDVFAKVNAGLSSTDLLAALKQIDGNLNSYGLDASGLKDAKLLLVTLEKFVSYWQTTIEPKAKNARIVGTTGLGSALKCAAGTVGGGILGGLTGAGAGSVVPAIGTTIGGVLGAIGGALSGAAASCG